jgi:PAS domain S-box-containing protein
MGSPRAGTGADPDLAPDQSAAAVLDFAVTQLLRDGAGGAIDAVMARLVTAFGLRAAVAFQPSATRPVTVLAADPHGAAGPGLLATIGRLPIAQRDWATASLAPAELTVTLDGHERNALVAYSVPAAGDILCAVALIGDEPGWSDALRSTAHAVAALVAARIRQRSELATLASRQAFGDALFVRSPNAIITMDPGRRITELNAAAEALTGHRREDLIGKEMSALLIAKRDRPRLRTLLKALEPGIPAGPVGAALVRADGTERTVELTLLRLIIEADTSLSVYLRDLTDLERSHAALERSHTALERSHAELADQTERLNCLIATAIPGAIITDERGRITHISQSFGAMFGIPEPSRLVGTAAASVLRRIKGEFKDPGEFVRRASAVFRGRQVVSGEQITAADGRTIECDHWPVLVDDAYRGDLWLLWDMSDRVEIEQQRERELAAELDAHRIAEEQNVHLRELDDARNQFVAMVSHELRTPLTSIVSFSELIRGEAEGLTADGIRFLDIIERNAERLLRLIGDLLLLSRLEAGVLPLDLAPVAIPELIAEAVKLTAPAAGSQDIAVDVTVGDGPPVLGDARRLLQVLDNLIGNAVKFSHLHGRVRVTASYNRARWRIDVADSGIGIPPGEAARLFGRFVRASNARTAGLPGTGLGLSIVKVITEMHGGQVSVETGHGQGATFTVYLPVAP